MLGACNATPPVLYPRPYYRDSGIGSEAQWNPLTVIANHGFDQLRTSERTDFTRYPYGASFAAVLRSVMRPDKPIRRYGTEQWLRNEVFPLSLKSGGGGQWYPNYTLHLFGGGITYSKLEDWYVAHGVTNHPRLVAGATTYAYHLLVEAMENGPTADKGVDALSDLLIFDSASILLWNQGWMRQLFGQTIEVNDWLGQVSAGFSGRTIENASSMIVVRAPLPRTDDWRLMITHGYAFMVGVSRRLPGNNWLTVGSGADAPATPVIDSTTGKKTATLEPNAGVFVDHDGSLIASLITRGGSNNGLTLNLYPTFWIGPVRPGFWIQQDRSGGFRFGMSSLFGLGISTHSGTR